MESFTKLVKQNWLMLLIIIAATVLRTWKLDTQGILFSDAGRDLRVAEQSVLTKQLPLLGIPSSVPRFHQGPLTIWLEMGVFLIAGHQTLAFQLTFAFLGILAIIGCYEFATVYLGKPTGILAATFMAFSPLAIAHSRVPYHTTPIPLMIIIFLFNLMILWTGEKTFPRRLARYQRYSIFGAVLSWVLLMQFELSLFALGLLLPYVLWRRKSQSRNNHRAIPSIDWKNLRLMKLNGKWRGVILSSAALVIGFAPQLIHDFTHPLSQNQLGGFMAWIIYRVVSLTGLTGSPVQGESHLLTAFQSFGHYFNRMFGVEQLPLTFIFIGLLSWTLVRLLYKTKLSQENSASGTLTSGTLAPGIELVSVATLILTVSYFVHGSPSEAYFPPYLVFLPLLVSWGVTQLVKSQQSRVIMGVIVASWAIWMSVSVFQAQFFVSNQDNQAEKITQFSYGASTGELRQIARYLQQLSVRPIYLTTTADGGQFSSYFDNLLWIMGEDQFSDSEQFDKNIVIANKGMSFEFLDTQSSTTPHIFYLEQKDSELQSYPDITKVIFPTYDLYIR